MSLEAAILELASAIRALAGSAELADTKAEAPKRGRKPKEPEASPPPLDIKSQDPEAPAVNTLPPAPEPMNVVKLPEAPATVATKPLARADVTAVAIDFVTKMGGPVAGRQALMVHLKKAGFTDISSIPEAQYGPVIDGLRKAIAKAATEAA